MTFRYIVLGCGEANELEMIALGATGLYRDKNNEYWVQTDQTEGIAYGPYPTKEVAKANRM